MCSESEKITPSEYSEFFAEFYDILHSHLEDVDAYKELADRFGPKILELGSGTGRILVPLAKEGHDITGLEVDSNMLDVCREKLERMEDKVCKDVDLVKADMRDFELCESFDLILMPCNLINYLTDISDLKKTLSCVKKHLSDDGVLIVDNSVPDVERMVEHDGEEQVFEYENPRNGRKIVDSFTATYDFVEQIEHDKIVISEYEGQKKIREAEIQERLTFYFPRELRNIIENQGYEIFEERGSLQGCGPITEESEEMVFFCRNSE